jgi:trehalose 6-phosphate synthase/phosphatase
MQKVLKSQDVVRWAEDFIGQLEKVYKKQGDIFKKNLSIRQSKMITAFFKNSEKRLLLLDYDGTLVPFAKNPAEAIPTQGLLNLLGDLAHIRGVDIAIISGRSRDFLDSIFNDRDMMIFAEHGAYRRIHSEWISLSGHSASWQHGILKIMQDITDDTPGSVIEKKETALVWHYRNTDSWLADLRVIQLVNRLVGPCTSGNLQLMRGNKIIEVKPSEYSKGTAITGYFDFGRYDFILAAGDDVTDEDMFEVLPENAITIKIGRPSEKSKYTIATSREFISLLTQLKNEH